VRVQRPGTALSLRWPTRRSGRAIFALLILTLLPVILESCAWQTHTEPAPPATVGGSTLNKDGPRPSSPIRAAFYYQWFPEGWRQAGTFPYTIYTPTAGLYDSGSAATIAAQVMSMRYGNINAAIVSWWGANQKSEQVRVPALLAGAAGVDQNFRIALYYEKEGNGDPTVDEIKGDLGYITREYAGQPNYLRIDGRPVIFVYDANDGNCAVVDRWRAANVDDAFYLDLKVVPGYSHCAFQPDGWHQYAPAEATSDVSDLSTASGAFSISPGFAPAPDSSGSGIARPFLGRDTNRWIQEIRSMVASGTRWQLITTFNEWGEGTAVESADQWATTSGQGAYLDALHTVDRT
jgi:hypothetical protein